MAVIQGEVLDLHLCYDLDIRLTLKFLYVPYVGPIWQYIAMYCRIGIHTGTYNRNFRVFGMAFCGSILGLGKAASKQEGPNKFGVPDKKAVLL